jgi:TolB-like protein/class 3 adenylate cyclase/tetratricopeptide (TPR) repeat protein
VAQGRTFADRGVGNRSGGSREAVKATATRRLAAILAADVAGYSRLMGTDEEGTHERLKAHLREVVEPKIREHRGRIVNTTGDGVLAEFASVVDGVHCAGEIQRAMADRDLDLAEERRLRFRIGVNLGDVIADGGDIYGDGVNIAARLEGPAAPGSICVSGTVRDHIGDRLPYAFEDMGEQSVKNIARPVRAYALRPEGLAAVPAPGLPARPSRRDLAIFGTVAAAVLVIACLAWWFWPAATSRSGAGKPADQATASSTPMPTAPVATAISQPLVAPRLSIVVLPFANLNNDPDRQYFADGITEDLTTDLSRIADMFVISRNTAFTYRNKPLDTKQIGRELGVRYVLEGSVRRAGDQVRVTAQLIDTETDAHLWAERFDRATGDLFALQDEITSRIAVTLHLELVRTEAGRATEHPEALDYIFRGRAAQEKPPSRDRFAEQIGLFEHALALDPRSVEAQSWLAVAITGRVMTGWADSAAADIARAEGLVGQALAASPQSMSAHYAKGQVLLAQNRFEEAIPEYETVLASNRNWVRALRALGQCKLFTGSIEETIPLVERAIRLSPRDPDRGYWYSNIGNVHLLQSHTDEAIAWLEKARIAMPQRPAVHADLASAYGLKGETERAATELAEARRLIGDDRYSSIARLKTVVGYWGVPKIRALYEATYFVGLRNAGVPEE